MTGTSMVQLIVQLIGLARLDQRQWKWKGNSQASRVAAGVLTKRDYVPVDSVHIGIPHDFGARFYVKRKVINASE